MSDKIKSFIDCGTGVYSISRKEAGEIHKAAKKVKNYAFSSPSNWRANTASQTLYCASCGQNASASVLGVSLTAWPPLLCAS